MSRIMKHKKIASFVAVLQIVLLLVTNIRVIAATDVYDPGNILEEFDEIGTWQAVENCSIAIDTTVHNRGLASLKMTSTPTTTSGAYSIEETFATPKDLSNLENVEMNIYIEDLAAVNTVSLMMMTDGGNFYVNYVGQWELMKGWNTVRRTFADFLKAGNADIKNIGKLGIRVEETQGKKANINVDRISYNMTGKTNILFTFDDGSSGVYDYAYPLMQTKGMLGTTWACKDLSTSGDTAFMSPDVLKNLYAAGWDIGNHTVNHVDDITTLPSAKKKSEYQDNITWLDSLGFTRSSVHACFPMGSFDDELLSILPTIGVKSARTTIHGLQTTLPVEDIYRLKTVAVGRDSVVSEIKADIDQAVKTGTSIFFMFHDVAPTPNPTDPDAAIVISTANFTEIMNYANDLKVAGKIKIPTISQWYDEYQASIGNTPTATATTTGSSIETTTTTGSSIETTTTTGSSIETTTTTGSSIETATTTGSSIETTTGSPIATATPTPIVYDHSNGGGGGYPFYMPTATPTPVPTATPTLIPTPTATPTLIPMPTPTKGAIRDINSGVLDDINTPIKPMPAAGGFKDTLNHWAEPVIIHLLGEDVISGYEDETIRPDNEISRAEAAILIARSLKLEAAKDDKTEFIDDGELPGWAKGYIKVTAQQGIIRGYEDKSFKPKKRISRQELVVMVMNAFKFSANTKEMTFSDKDTIQEWAKHSVELAISLKILNGYPDNTFRGSNSITRAEGFAVLSKSLLEQKNQAK